MPDLPQTRHSLLVRLTDHSQDAWVEFVDIYQQSLLAFARSKGLQDADALDLTQQVMQAVEKKLPSWKLDRQNGSFRGWLFRVARNIAIDTTRRQFRSPATGRDTELQHAPEGADGSEFDLEFARQVFAWAVKQARPHFAESTWAAFVMTSIENQKPSAVANELGLSTGRVYAARYRVVAKLQKLVSDFQESCELPSLTDFRDKGAGTK